MEVIARRQSFQRSFQSDVLKLIKAFEDLDDNGTTQKKHSVTDQKEELDTLHREIKALKDEAILQDKDNNAMIQKIEDTSKFDNLQNEMNRVKQEISRVLEDVSLLDYALQKSEKEKRQIHKDLEETKTRFQSRVENSVKMELKVEELRQSIELIKTSMMNCSA